MLKRSSSSYLPVGLRPSLVLGLFLAGRAAILRKALGKLSAQAYDFFEKLKCFLEDVPFP